MNEHTEPRTVLLVDDEPDSLDFLRAILEDHDYRVLVANNAHRGLQLVREQRPDLICLDVLMPEESGMSLYRKLRSDAELKRIPVLITSGLSFSRELRNIEYRIGDDGSEIAEPDGIVEKPVRIDLFIAAVRKALR
jgi:CheY-like chemotaxis protein